MPRTFIGLFALVLWASVALGASAQQPPPPEGAPQASNPYAQPYPQNPTTSNAPNPAMLARAKNWFASLQAGKIDRSQLAPSANSSLTDEMIASARSMVGSLGKPISFVQQQAGTQGGVSYAVYLLSFRNGKKIDFLFAEDAQGKVVSLRLGSPK